MPGERRHWSGQYYTYIYRGVFVIKSVSSQSLSVAFDAFSSQCRGARKFHLWGGLASPCGLGTEVPQLGSRGEAPVGGLGFREAEAVCT